LLDRSRARADGGALHADHPVLRRACDGARRAVRASSLLRTHDLRSMYYEPRTQKSGLPHNPFTACCVPRPIGWISTVSTDGVPNIAPCAQFQNVTSEPPTVLSSGCGWPAKDTLKNALEPGEFVWNMATYDLRQAVAGTAVTYPPGVNEF